MIGLDFNAAGNHEFDEGVYELIRMQEGGCHPVDGCLDGDDLDALVKYFEANSPIAPGPHDRIIMLP